MTGRAAASRRMAALAAAGAVLVVMTTPVGLIEVAVTSAGLSELVPAAAPPLGLTARWLIAAVAGVMAMGFVLATGRKEPAAEGEEIMGFALSRLTAFARRGRTGRTDDMPVLRRADAHPDAPARRPIFANSDLGAEGMFARPVAVDPAPLAMPRSPAPTLVEEPEGVDAGYDAATDDWAKAGFLPPAETDAARDGIVSEPPAAQTPQRESLEGLSVAELTARFERGLARRTGMAGSSAPMPAVPSTGVLADIPPAPRVAVKPDVDMELDEALRAALGALRGSDRVAR